MFLGVKGVLHLVQQKPLKATYVSPELLEKPLHSSINQNLRILRKATLFSRAIFGNAIEHASLYLS